MSLPPYAISTGDGYGAIAHASPEWSHSNFQDRGRQHGEASTRRGELASSGFQNWYSQSDRPAAETRRLVKQVEAPHSSVYAEPVVAGAHSTYYGRRANTSDDPTAFRRSIRQIIPHIPEDRPQGKRQIPEPYGPPPRAQGTRGMPEELRYKESPSIPEPGMPRLARPYGATILRECDQELSYERAMGRKVRLGQDTYRGSGRAGDMSQSFAPPKRPEDIDVGFFKSLKDSPTFIRFVNSLPPKPERSPHDRHQEGLRRQREAARQAEKELVASLVLPGEDDH